MRFLPSQIEWAAHILGGGESQGKNEAAHLDKRVHRSILLGCGFSSSGLRYLLRKPQGIGVEGACQDSGVHWPRRRILPADGVSNQLECHLVLVQGCPWAESGGYQCPAADSCLLAVGFSSIILLLRVWVGEELAGPHQGGKGRGVMRMSGRRAFLTLAERLHG